MKRSKFTEKQILDAIQEMENDIPVSGVSRKLGVAAATLYNWRSQYASMTQSERQQLRQLKEENQPLKRMYADLP